MECQTECDLCKSRCTTRSRNSLGQLEWNVMYAMFGVRQNVCDVTFARMDCELCKTFCTIKSTNKAGMWRMEGCLCRLRQNVNYASPIAQQSSLETWLECDKWHVCVGSDRMWVIQISFAQLTWLWDCLDLPQRFKSELGPLIMHDITILSYPPI